MTTKSLAYDHAAYIARVGAPMGEAGGAATTQYGKFAAFTAAIAFSAQFTTTVAGTVAGHGFQVVKISGTTTTALGTQTIGTATAGSTFNLVLAGTATGGVALLQGDVLAAISLADATGKAAVAYEVQNQPLANVTI